LIRCGWFAALAILGAASSAHAGEASLASATATAPAWQGFYAGVYASDDITVLHLDMQDAFSFDGIGGESGFGGALVGDDNHFAERWVDGAEIDAALATGSSRFDISDGPDDFNSSVSGEWGASLKGRIGYLVSPDTLFYAFGGGGGIETWLNRNLSVRAQYEYAMFGNLAASEGITVDSHVGTATLGAVLHFGK